MFIPLHDSNPLRHIAFPAVTWTIIALNVALYLGLGDLSPERPHSLSAILDFALFTHAIGMDPGPFAQGPLPFEGLRLVTYAFLHGDVWHLAGNMLFLWVFGDNVEDDLGHPGFLGFYLFGALAAGLAHVWAFPDSDLPLVGASGAVSAVMAAYVILHPRVRVWVLVLGRLPLRLPALWVILAWAGLQLVFLVFDPGDGVSYAAHVGGLAAGAATLPLVRRRRVR